MDFYLNCGLFALPFWLGQLFILFRTCIRCIHAIYVHWKQVCNPCKSITAAIICYQMQSNAITHSIHSFRFRFVVLTISHFPSPERALETETQASNVPHLSTSSRFSSSTFLLFLLPISPYSCAPVSRKCVRSLNANIFAECQWRPSTILPLSLPLSRYLSYISQCPFPSLFFSLYLSLSLSLSSLLALS